MVTETWVKEGHFDAEVNIDGYITHCRDRVTNGRNSKGGVIIYTKDKQIIEQMVSLEKPSRKAKWIMKNYRDINGTV